MPEFLSKYLSDSPSSWLVALVIFVVLAIVFWSVKRFIYFGLRKAVAKTSFSFDSAFIEASSRPMSIVAIVLALNAAYFIFLSMNDNVENSRQLLDNVSRVLSVVAIVVFADGFIRRCIQFYSNQSPMLQTSAGILTGSLRVLLIVIGALIVLSTLGISITPVIASLGIGSLAVALALQSTLENFFSGVQLVADKPIRVGDYIELDSGEQGYVEKIGWRSTWIKMLPNNIVVMPNSVLANSKLINYSLPQQELSVPVEVSVHYDSDLERVEQVALEEANIILRDHKWGVETYEPFVVFHTFDSSSINFTVMLRVKEYFNRFFVKSEYIKLLHKRFGKEGIVIPYPIRAINTEQEAPNKNT